MPDGVVQLRLVAHTQGRTHLVRLLRFRIGGSVAPGSRRTKPNRFALEPATPRNRGVIQNNLDKFRIIQHYLDTFRMQVLTASGQTQSCPGPGATVFPCLSSQRRIHGVGHKSGHSWWPRSSSTWLHSSNTPMSIRFARAESAAVAVTSRKHIAA